MTSALTPALIGTGGHAKVVLEALIMSDPACADRITLRDGNPARAGGTLRGLTIQTPELAPDMAGHAVHVAIGQNTLRLRLIHDAQKAGAGLLSIRHPWAFVSPTALVEGATFAAASCVIGPDAQIGTGTIVNHGAIVDHDCRIGAACHIAPGAVLGGNVTIGEAVLVGANATILPGLTIGANAIIGAGSVVTKAVPAGGRWIGAALVPDQDKGAS